MDNLPLIRVAVATVNVIDLYPSAEKTKEDARWVDVAFNGKRLS